LLLYIIIYNIIYKYYYL